MSRDYRPFLADIQNACRKIEKYTDGLSFEAFVKDERTWDAVLRNLTVVGEAVKQLPEPIRTAHPNTDWRNVARFRDIVVHHYFAINERIVWDIVCNEIPKLLSEVERIIVEQTESAPNEPAV